MPPSNQSQRRAPVKWRLGFLNGNRDDDLVMQYNPTKRDLNRNATYANNQAALADFPNTLAKQQPAIEWIRNEAEEMDVELFFSYRGDKDCERELQKLDDFMRPNRTTGKPSDLIFVAGTRSDRVRIMGKRVTEELYTPTGRVQQARVRLTLKCLTSRSTGGG